VAVVTGAGRAGGIGWATAERLLGSGWTVVVSDVVDDESRPEHSNALFHHADVREPHQVEALADAALDRFGRLDAWINNAGLTAGLVPLTDVSDEEWRANIEVMASGTFYGCRAATKRMLAGGNGWGRIVNVSSQAGKRGLPMFSAYCAAKFAIIGITQALACEVASQGITVNAVCPGTVDTPLLDVAGGVWDAMAKSRGISVEEYRERAVRRIPIGRLIDAEEVAATIAFLCSDEAAAVTGASLNVSGGEAIY
jgi:NAD(P)-dependent dehydrogenase (short-subunit alcohol dehydrogenase family)